MDLSSALSEVKSLPDEALHKELQSGYLPSFLVLGEIQDRKTLRASAPVKSTSTSIKEQVLTRGFSRGGMVASLNPFEAYSQALRNQKLLAKQRPQTGISALAEPPMPGYAPELGTLVPLMPGTPKMPRQLSAGGLVTLLPHQRALLDAIAARESGGRYDIAYGGRKISDFSRHPGVGYRITSGPNAGLTSSASGRYQFIKGTWDQQKKKLGLPDFSPRSQDLAAWDLAKTEYARKTGGSLDAALTSGDPSAIAGVGRALHGQWTSLPGGIEQGQGVKEFVGRFLRGPQNVAVNATGSVGSGIAAAAQSGAAVAGQAAATQAAQTAAQAAAGKSAMSAASKSPLGGLMSLMALSAMSKAPAVPTKTNMTVPRPRAPVDPEVLTEETSETPDWYRRRRAIYG